MGDKKEGDVIIITNEDEFDRALIDSVTKYAVIYFSATWCGPCKLFSPKIKKMATNYRDKARFYKIDVDEKTIENVVSKQGVRYMPTVLFFKNGKRLEQHDYIGGDAAVLSKRIEDVVGITRDNELREKARIEKEQREKKKQEMEERQKLEECDEQQQSETDNVISEQNKGTT